VCVIRGRRITPIDVQSVQELLKSCLGRWAWRWSGVSAGNGGPPTEDSRDQRALANLVEMGRPRMAHLGRRDRLVDWDSGGSSGDALWSVVNNLCFPVLPWV
jgi:hypothetical protein